jgi:S-adenosylmethionine hydrolase
MAAGKISGQVVAISPEGNLVTDISADALARAPRDERVIVRCDEHETNGIFTPEHNQPAFTFLAQLGAAGKLELVIVGDNASLMLGIRTGTTVEVEWN